MRGERLIRWLGIEDWSTSARRLLAVVAVCGLLVAARAWWVTLSDLESLRHEHWDQLHWVLLCILTVSVAGLSIKIVGTRGIITVSDTFVFTSVLLFGGTPSVALGWLDGVVGTFRFTRKPASILYSSSMMALSITVSSWAFETVGYWTSDLNTVSELSALLLPLMALTGVHFLITTLGVSLVLSLRGGGALAEIWKRDFLLSALTYVSGAVATALIYMMIQRFGMSAFFVVAPFILFVYWNYRVYSDRLLDYSQSLERKVAERTQELEAANRRLRELDRLKTEFLNVVAHDLRTPLTSIMAYSQLMVLHPDNTKKFPRYAKTIYEETSRLRDLINNVLDLSKMEAGRMVYNMEPLHLEEILRHFFKLFHSLAMSNNVSIALELPENLPLVLGDRDRIGQALCNLLNNAIKFTRSQGTVFLEARTMEHGEASWVEVRVTDQGPGVPDLDREHIFEKYHTVQQHSHKAKEGTGLGLPIAKQIIDAHKGDIGVDSVPDEGSTFWFRLPVIDETSGSGSQSPKTVEEPLEAMAFRNASGE